MSIAEIAELDPPAAIAPARELTDHHLLDGRAIDRVIEGRARVVRADQRANRGEKRRDVEIGVLALQIGGEEADSERLHFRRCNPKCTPIAR